MLPWKKEQAAIATQKKTELQFKKNQQKEKLLRLRAKKICSKPELMGVCIAVGKFWSLSDFLIKTVPLTILGMFFQRSQSAQVCIGIFSINLGCGAVSLSAQSIAFTAIEIEANEILRIRSQLNQMLADNTGQPIERIAKDTVLESD